MYGYNVVPDIVQLVSLLGTWFPDISVSLAS